MVKLFTHTDLDGIGCAVLAKLAFGKYVDISYCDYDNIDSTVKKYWETGEKNDFGKECYKLHFSQFYEEDDENVVAGFVQDEIDENRFIYVSKELNVEYDTLFADNIEDAKHQIEDMLIDHWNDEIDYLENRIKSFQGEE